jgi:hypothetical protein
MYLASDEDVCRVMQLADEAARAATNLQKTREAEKRVKRTKLVYLSKPEK